MLKIVMCPWRKMSKRVIYTSKRLRRKVLVTQFTLGGLLQGLEYVLRGKSCKTCRNPITSTCGTLYDIFVQRDELGSFVFHIAH